MDTILYSSYPALKGIVKIKQTLYNWSNVNFARKTKLEAFYASIRKP